MSLFNFKSKQAKELINFAKLQTDIHSHLIPAIDDGSQDMETSLMLLQELENLGFSKVITTPHVKNEAYPNDVKTFETLADDLRQAAVVRGLKIKIEIGAEHLIDDIFHKRIIESAFKTFGNNYLLVELPFMYFPLGFEEYLFELQCKNYNVVLAHPERYLYWANNYKMYEKLKDSGVIFQANINSFVGYYGKVEYSTVKWLAQNNMIEILGSDTHGMRHIEMLHKALKSPLLNELINSGKIINDKF